MDAEVLVTVDYSLPGCCQITLNRPERRNALGETLIERLLDCLQEAEATPTVHTLILSGAGTSFCSGLDLSSLDSETDASLTWRLLRIETLLQRLYVSPLRVVSLAHGHAFGAGADILVASQVRVLDPSSTVRFPGAQFGICLGFCRLSERIGSSAAMELVDNGRTLSATDAERIGLASTLANQSDWPRLIERLSGDPPRIHANARATFLAQLKANCFDRDMASIAQTASVPGLKVRIQKYIGRSA